MRAPTFDLEAMVTAMIAAMDEDLDDGAIWADFGDAIPADAYDAPETRRLAAELGIALTDDNFSSCFVLSHAGRSAYVWWDAAESRGRVRFEASGRDVRAIVDPASGESRLEIDAPAGAA